MMEKENAKAGIVSVVLAHWPLLRRLRIASAALWSSSTKSKAALGLRF
jgi:hypothetical protein